MIFLKKSGRRRRGKKREDPILVFKYIEIVVRKNLTPEIRMLNFYYTISSATIS